MTKAKPHIRERKKLVAEAQMLAAKSYDRDLTEDQISAIFERLKEIDHLVYGELS